MATFNAYVKGVRSCFQSTWHLVLQYIQDDIIQVMRIRRERLGMSIHHCGPDKDEGCATISDTCAHRQLRRHYR
jgi:hypothetical protein